MEHSEFLRIFKELIDKNYILGKTTIFETWVYIENNHGKITISNYIKNIVISYRIGYEHNHIFEINTTPEKFVIDLIELQIESKIPKIFET